MINPNPPMSLSDLQQQLPTNNRWEHLVAMYHECSSMFGTLLAYPQGARDLDPISNAEEKKELQRILRNIQTDSEKFLNELNEIYSQHCTAPNQPRKGLIYDTLEGADLFQYTAIAASYRSWMDNFEALTMQPVADFIAITEIISKRNATTAS
jgi:hypothetical protein